MPEEQRTAAEEEEKDALQRQRLYSSESAYAALRMGEEQVA
jgi:hypothetical protein